MAITFDRAFEALGRKPYGFAAFIGYSPDEFRRSANKVSAIGRRCNARPIDLDGRRWPTERLRKAQV